MFNLLPKAEKEAIRKEYHLRLTVVTLFLLLATLLIALLLLVPSYALSSQREKGAERQFELLSETVKKQNSAEQKAALLDAQTRLQLLPHESPAGGLYPHEFFMHIAARKGPHISLESLAFGTVNGKQTATIGGKAQTRSALLAYITSLEQSRLFERVNAPISDFTKDADLTFSITAVIAASSP